MPLLLPVCIAPCIQVPAYGMGYPQQAYTPIYWVPYFQDMQYAAYMEQVRQQCMHKQQSCTDDVNPDKNETQDAQQDAFAKTQNQEGTQPEAQNGKVEDNERSDQEPLDKEAKIDGIQNEEAQGLEEVISPNYSYDARPHENATQGRSSAATTASAAAAAASIAAFHEAAKSANETNLNEASNKIKADVETSAELAKLEEAANPKQAEQNFAAPNAEDIVVISDEA